jgi:peptide/nickel transport system permease protein
MRKLASRLVHSLLLIACVSVCAFGLLSITPGNFFDELRLNPQVSPETVDALAKQYGMNKPFPVRYARWVASAVRGDFGYSLSYHTMVGTLLWARVRYTLLLASLATLLAWVVALPWGVLEALHQGGWIDRVGGILTAVLLTIPDVLLGLLLLLLAARTGWFPTGGMASLGSNDLSVLDRFRDLSVHLFLPVLALVFGTVPVLVRHVRAAMIAVLKAPFLESARAHGIAESRLLWRHAFPVARNTLISILGYSIGTLLSMSLLIEVILSWPGLGPLVLEAILARDIYVVMAVVLLSSVFVVVGNFLSDALLYYSDPRIREVDL